MRTLTEHRWIRESLERALRRDPVLERWGYGPESILAVAEPVHVPSTPVLLMTWGPGPRFAPFELVDRLLVSVHRAERIAPPVDPSTVLDRVLAIAADSEGWLRPVTVRRTGRWTETSAVVAGAREILALDAVVATGDLRGGHRAG